MRKLIFTTFFSCLSLIAIQAQVIASWNSTTGSGATGVTAGTASRGAGIAAATGTCTNNVLTSNNFFDTGDAGGEAEAVAEDEYLEFPITAQTGYSLTVTSVTFTRRRSGTGVQNYAVYNGSTTNLGSGTQPTADACEETTIDITDVTIPEGTTVDFRLFGWGATSTAGNWRMAGVSFSGTSTPLPVELTAFYGENAKNLAKLHFTTASELNNSHFSIERSQDGINFREIGRISGAGTSFVFNDYSFVDVSPFSGKNYYRLKQVDFDGNFEYSEVVMVDMGTRPSTRLYPSMANDAITLEFASEMEETGELLIFDRLGRLVVTHQIEAGITSMQLPVVDLQAGQYTTSLFSQGTIENFRFVKQ